MNIYEIGQDFDNYKFFVFKEDDESNKGVWDYNGQSLINEWKGLSLELFRDKRKKKDKRSEEFDASCYFSGCLIVNKRTSLLLSENLKGQIEVLPVCVTTVCTIEIHLLGCKRKHIWKGSRIESLHRGRWRHLSHPSMLHENRELCLAK